MNNQIYIYENSLSNLLTLIKYLISHQVKPFNIKDNNYESTLLDEIIELNLKNQSGIKEEIIKSFSRNVYEVIYYTYLSSDNNKELVIYYLYLNALKYGSNVLKHRYLNCVNKALQLAQYVKREAHRLKGFVRFQELENKILYAQIEPTNNIIELLSVHFKERLKNEYWMILDKKRKIVSIYDLKRYYIFNSECLKIEENYNQEEKEIAEMWKAFYQRIGIKERKNDKCRRNFMPKKYWQNILEVRDEK